MSGESAPKHRLVLCPKCRRLLQEFPNYDVYKCGGCGTILQAKKRRSGAANSESSANGTDTAPRNALDRVSDDNQYRKREQLVTAQENGLRVKASSSSSGECSSDGNSGSIQTENDEGNREQLILPQENGVREKETISSSEECSLDGNDGTGQIENGEGNGEQAEITQENALREKETSSSSGERSLNRNDERGQTEGGESCDEQLVLPKENGLSEKASISSSGERSLGGNGAGNQIESVKCNGEWTVVPEEKDLREKANSSSSGESSSNGNDGLGQTENVECNGEQVNLSQENGVRKNVTRFSSGESLLHGNDRKGRIENGEYNGDDEVFPQENVLREKETNSSVGECSSDGCDEGGQVGIGQGNGEQLRPFNLSEEELEEEMDIYKLSDKKHRVSNKGSSNELSSCEIKALSKLIIENSVDKSNGTNLQLAREELNNDNMPPERAKEELIYSLDEEDANNEKPALKEVNSEVHNTGRDLDGAEKLKPALKEVNSEVLSTGRDLEGVEKLNNENLLLQEAEQELVSGSEREEADIEKLALVGANSVVDITGSNEAEAEKESSISAADGEDAKNDQLALVLAKTEVDTTGSASTAKRCSTENFVSEKGNIAYRKLEEVASDDVSSPSKLWRQAQKSIRHSFDCVRHVDTVDATEERIPSSELSGTMGELSKSPTTRSYHAYDGSVSSNDGVDERFLTQHLGSLEYSNPGSNSVPEERSRKGKSLMLHGNLETHLPNAKYHATRDRRGDQNPVPGPARHGHPHWTRTKGDQFPSKIPFHRSGSQSGYESGSPSNQIHDELYSSSSFVSPDSRADPDEENMKLLSMFYILQDQLNRTRYANEEAHGRLSMDSYDGKHISAYHSHDLYEGRFFHARDYPWCDGRCGHGINWRQRPNFSRQYLAEATRSSTSNHSNHLCFRCCLEDWQCSAELHPYALHKHEELRKYHLGHTCCSSHCSPPTGPQWFTSSELAAYGHETKSGDQRHTDPEMKRYLREKQNLNKRHFRPVAGGAPFVTCYKCSKLLQLPSDFLLFRRVCHRLKCGGCSEVLKFSLQNRSHIVSYAPNAPGPPSSDLDDPNEGVTTSNLHSASRAEPVSYSNEYSHSVRQSNSSEVDPVSLTPLQALHLSEHDKPSVPHGTFQPITEGKIASRAPTTNESASHSSDVSGSEKSLSEMEARQPPKSSPLHQLMGYSSPSLVIRGLDSSFEGKETTVKEESNHSSQEN